MCKRVLIVEDNVLNMKQYDGFLQAQGYGTLHSNDGSDIIDVVKEHRPDLIVMDIQLPKRSGVELTKILKADERFKDIPVIAVTAFAMKGDEDKVREAGCDDFIIKPISSVTFLNVVQKYLS